jgi:hypothetical protein
MMPYFIYKVFPDDKNSQKNFTLVDTFEEYKTARERARMERQKQDESEKHIFKIIFADNEDDAETTLTTPRETPILKEWEK